MSKSLGNVIDPIDIMDGIPLSALHEKLRTGNLDPKEITMAEKYQKTAFPDGIPECGADALRFTLIQYTTGGGDIAFDIKVMHAFRRFANKIFQSFKYVVGILGDFEPGKKSKLIGDESAGDKWILSRLSATADTVNRLLKDREFAYTTQAIHKYYYDEFCDTYIEFSKIALRSGNEKVAYTTKNTLYTALEGGLLLLHPFMPFITEELWQRLPRREGDKTPSITIAEYPEGVEAFEASKDEVARFDLALKASQGIKSLHSTNSPKNPKYFIKPKGDTSLSGVSIDDIHILCQYLKLTKDSIAILGTDQESPSAAITYDDVRELTVYLLNDS